MNRLRSGVSLIELIVCVAVLGLMASVATLAMRGAEPRDRNDPATVIRDTLERVLGTGMPATLQFTVNGRPALATINPDGTVLADSILGIDRFTGRSTRAP
jgi:prepilin-type N-terminal cleavage/methylation domain-containing protein